MSGIPRVSVTLRSASAISNACASDSIWHGPAISTNGRWLPTSISPTRTTRSDNPGLLDERSNEAGEQRMRAQRLRFQLRVILPADEPGMPRQLDRLRQHPIRRHARKPHPGRLETLAVIDVHLVAVPVPFADPIRFVDARDQRFLGELPRVSPEPH